MGVGNVSGMGKGPAGRGVEEAVSSSSPGPHQPANGGGRWRLCICTAVESLAGDPETVQRAKSRGAIRWSRWCLGGHDDQIRDQIRGQMWPNGPAAQSRCGPRSEDA